MKKLFIAIVILGVGGYAAYAFVLRPPEKRACMRLAELCGGQASGDDVKQCTQMLDDLKKDNAAEVKKVAACLDAAQSCSEGAGCVAGTALSVGAGMARDFFDGVRKALQQK